MKVAGESPSSGSGSISPDAAKGKVNPVFYRFMFSRAIGSICFSLFLLFFAWKLIVVYKSVFLVGMIPTIYLGVDILLSVPLGHLVDRVSNSLLSLVASLFMLAGFLIFLLGFSFYLVYAVTILVSISVTMKGGSLMGLMKRLASPDGINRATSHVSAAFSLSGLIGVAAGGFSLIFLGKYTPYVLIAGSIAAIALSIPIKNEPGRNIAGEKGTSGEYREALAFMKRIWTVLVFALVINGFFISLDVYASGLFNIYLKSNPIFYTLFVASFPAGMLIGSMLSSRIYPFLDNAMVTASLLFLLAPLVILIGLSPYAVVDVIAAGFMGFILPLINVPINAKLTKVIPMEWFGRSMAMMRIFTGGSTPVMAVFFSFLSIFLTVPEILLYVGILMFPFSLFGLKVVRTLYSVSVAGGS